MEGGRASDAQTKLLASLSYKSVLQRGFALVRDDADQPVRAAADVRRAQHLTVEFVDGRISVHADGAPPTLRQSPSRRRAGLAVLDRLRPTRPCA